MQDKHVRITFLLVIVDTDDGVAPSAPPLLERHYLPPSAHRPGRRKNSFSESSRLATVMLSAIHSLNVIEFFLA
jgi:hypothetical protein